MLYYINDRIGVLELCMFSCGLGMCYKWGDKQKYLNASSLKNVLATFLHKYIAPMLVSFILYV